MNVLRKIIFSIAIVVFAFFILAIVFTPVPARDNNLVLGLIVVPILIWVVAIIFIWLFGKVVKIGAIRKIIDKLKLHSPLAKGVNRRKVFITLSALFLLSNLGLAASDFTAQKKFLSTEKILVFEKASTYKTVPAVRYENNYGDHSAYSAYVFFDFLFAIIALISLEGLVLLLDKALEMRFSKIKRFLMALGLQLLLLVPPAVLIASSEVVTNVVLDEAKKITKTTTDQLLTQTGRQKLGIDDDLTVITKKIEASERIPQVINNDPEFTINLVISILGINDGTKRSILETIAIPQVLYESGSNTLLEKLDKDQLLLPRNILAVRKLNMDLAKETLPILGRKVVFNQLKNRAGKEDPEYKFMTDKEYLELRERQKDDQRREIILGIGNAKNNVAYYDKYISDAQAGIRELDSEYIRYKDYGEDWVRKCNAAKGENDQFCKDGRGTMESELAKLASTKDTYSRSIQDAEEYKRTALGYLYLWNKIYEEFTKNPYTPRDEAGTFFSPNKVQILFDGGRETNFQFLDYLATVVHEQLHYFSSSKKTIKIYFEEAITDYLTEDVLGTSGIVVRPGSGYPQERQVIRALAKEIPMEEIISFYFSGNESAISQSFNKKMKTSFKDFSSKMELLYYLPPNDSNSRDKLMAGIIDQLKDRTAGTNSNESLPKNSPKGP